MKIPNNPTEVSRLKNEESGHRKLQFQFLRVTIGLRSVTTFQARIIFNYSEKVAFKSSDEFISGNFWNFVFRLSCPCALTLKPFHWHMHSNQTKLTWISVTTISLVYLLINFIVSKSKNHDDIILRKYFYIILNKKS